MKQPAWRFHSPGVVLDTSGMGDKPAAIEQKAPQPQVRDKEYEILQLESYTAEE